MDAQTAIRVQIGDFIIQLAVANETIAQLKAEIEKLKEPTDA